VGSTLPENPSLPKIPRETVRDSGERTEHCVTNFRYFRGGLREASSNSVAEQRG